MLSSESLLTVSGSAAGLKCSVAVELNSFSVSSVCLGLDRDTTSSREGEISDNVRGEDAEGDESVWVGDEGGAT